VAYTYTKKIFSLFVKIFLSKIIKMSEIIDLSDVEELDIDYIELDPVSKICKTKFFNLIN
jgi:hypothetical protein